MLPQSGFLLQHTDDRNSIYYYVCVYLYIDAYLNVYVSIHVVTLFAAVN